MRSIASCALLILLALPAPTPAYIMRNYPLEEIFGEMGHVFVATVKKVEPERPGMVLEVGEQFKGKVPFERLAVNLEGDDDAKKDKHLSIILERVAPDVPVVVFSNKRGMRYTTYFFVNGSWFQMLGTAGADGSVRWAFTHGEPYLRRTFKGTTDELRQIIADGLAGKKKPPGVSEKEEPGFGPALKKEDKKDSRGRSPTVVFGLLPSFVVIGPLAFLAAVFPAVFGGLAIIMKRWMVLLSISCTASTLYFLHGWFGGSLAGSWWGTPQALWFSCAALCLVGVAWSARRYVAARQRGEDETYRSRRFDVITLWLLSAVCAIALFVAWKSGQSLTAFPFQEVFVTAGGVWLGALFLLGRRVNPGAISPETIVLAGLTLSMGMMGALEAGRSGNTSSGATNFAASGDTSLATPTFAGVLWTFQAPEKGVMYASPAVADDRVYVAFMHGLADAYGRVHALDLKTGSPVWMFDNDEALKPVFSTPVVADGMVYFGEGLHTDNSCSMFCLDAATGKKVWSFETKSHTEARPCVADGKVVFGAGNDGVYCLDAKTGAKLWQYTGEAGLHVDSNPCVANGRVYAGSGISRTHQATRIFCLDLATGKEVWGERVEYSAFASPAVDGDRVYFGIGNGNFSMDKEPVVGALLCRNAATGERIWQAAVPNSVLTEPTFDRACVYFGCRDGKLHAVDRATGKPAWEFVAGGPVLASPVLGRSAFTRQPVSVYVAAQKGPLYAVDVATGKSLWAFDASVHAGLAEAEYIATPVVITDRDGLKERRRILVGVGLKGGLQAPARLYCLSEETDFGAK